MLLLRFLLLAVVFVASSVESIAQDTHAFSEEIAEYKRLDSIKFPPKNEILFVGSSSIRFWNNVQQMFPGFKVINRGFGGSTLNDLNHYLDQIVIPYQPRQIVLYSGENDLAMDTIKSQELLRRFHVVFGRIRRALPQAKIIYVSIKPSPSRAHLFNEMKVSNMLIKDYLGRQPNTVFVDVYDDMVDRAGNAKADLFLEDNLHMNEKGYRIWQKAIRPHLTKK